MRQRLASILFWAAVVGLLLYRPLFYWHIPFSAITHAVHDDALLLRLAMELRDGNWLGAYNELTLVKGPFYSMFVAAASRLPLPLPVIEQAIYSLVALVAVWSIRPIVNSRWLLLGALGLLIVNPYSWGPLPARFNRDPMAAHMALLSMAGLVGMILRRDRSGADVAVWGALAGVAAAACWMTREEGLWIVAPGAMLLVVTSIFVLRSGEARSGFGRAAAMLFWPVAMGILPVLSVCAENQQHYGVFVVNELKTREFEDAYGALLRVGEKHHRPYVPVPSVARHAIYEVSPAFAELKPLLEGEQGRSWMFHRTMPDPQDMQGGWFIWAFREAVAQVHGPLSSPPLAFYRRLAEEVNGACDAGVLECGPERSGLATPLHEHDLSRLRASLGRLFARLVVWDRYRAETRSVDDSSPLALAARELVKTPLTGHRNVPVIRGWACAADGPVTMALLADGEYAKFKAQRLGSPDVASFLAASGKPWPSAESCRFEQVAPLEATHLVIYRGDTELGRIDLNAQDRVVVNDRFAASVDEFDIHVEPIVSRNKRIIRRAINGGFYIVQPVLMVIVPVWFVIGFIWVRKHFVLVCITGAVVGAIVIRTGLLAYIDATTYTIPENRYQEPTYTMLAYLIVLCASAAWHHFTSRPSLNEHASTT